MSRTVVLTGRLVSFFACAAGIGAELASAMMQTQHMTSIYRAVVRGHFQNLGDDRKATLLAEADQHDLLNSTFTANGAFFYDRQLVAFNLRYELRSVSNDSTDPTVAAEQEALEHATRWLAAEGIDHKHLRATVTDMASIWND